MDVPIDTTTFIQELSSGDHVSCIYKTDADLFSLVVPFFTAGFAQHNKCLYVFDEHAPDTIRRAFADAGFDLDPYVAKRDFVFLSKDEVYLKNGAFHADTIIESILGIASDIRAQGYTALRITGDASWLASRSAMASDVMKYEAKVNAAIQDSAVIALCQYREGLFDEHVLIDVLRTHPIVYLYDRFVSSKYFAPSDDFIPLANRPSLGLHYSDIVAALRGQPAAT